MNRDQWYQLLIKHHNVTDELERLENLLAPLEEDPSDGVYDLLTGLVQCCANVASRIDQTRKDTPNV